MFFLRHRRRARLRERPLTGERLQILERVPFYRALSEADQRELRGHTQVFLAEKYFEGCAGLRVTDEMRMSIAAQACRLLLHRETGYYPGLRSVLVYPARYIANGRMLGPAGMVTEGLTVRAGESWSWPVAGGPVVLSWRDALAGSADGTDGRNVVYHEFAHQLDAESGAMEGAPALPTPDAHRDWMREMGEAQRALAADLSAGRPTPLDPYAAENPAEFFAVLTEMFFERPADVLLWRRGVYEQMRGYFNPDPAAAVLAAPLAG
jgi:MtfA peptidase